MVSKRRRETTKVGGAEAAEGRMRRCSVPLTRDLHDRLEEVATPNHRAVGAQILFFLEGLYGLNEVARAEVLKLVGAK